MKRFDIPDFYRSSFVSGIKYRRNLTDSRKKDSSPTTLDFGPVKFIIARHFGFCYGVENAINIAYKTIEENPGRRIFLLSEMIHNPGVNRDLLSRGIKFLMDTSGDQILDWSHLNQDDIVIIPAFGTTIEIENKLNKIGIDIHKYNTTCPFVEKVWNRSEQLGNQGYTTIIHGKHYHEETRATFSHAVRNSPSIIIRNLNEAEILAKIILGEMLIDEFYSFYKGKYSPGFNPQRDLEKIGVVNQTTMLAEETIAIAAHLKKTMEKKYGKENLKNHFADTKDTLCYATNDNQDATYELLKYNADFAVVVGGYNSSNTTHIVELCQSKFKTFFISSPDNLLSFREIRHFNHLTRKESVTENYIPSKKELSIILTSGASCPDSVIDQVIQKFISFFPDTKTFQTVFEELFQTEK